MFLLVITFNTTASQYIQTEEYSKNIEPATEEIIEQYIILSETYWKIDKSKSDSIIKIVFNIIEEKHINNNILLGDAYHMLGKVLISNRKIYAGIDTLKISVLYKQNSNNIDQASLASTFNHIGYGFLWLQEFDSTIFYCNESKQLLNSYNIRDINLYLANKNIGIGYASLGKYNTAICYFDTAQIALNEIKNATDSLMIARFYNNYALIKTLTGQLQEANKYFEKAEVIFSEKFGNDHISIADINNNKGINSYFDYDFSKAELYYKKALEIYIINNTEKDKIPLIYNNLSSVSQNTNNFTASISYCKSGLVYSPGNDLKLVLNKNIAQSYAAIDNIEKANQYFKIALNLLKEENINPKRKQELYSSYASFLIKTNDVLSLFYYKKALDAAANLNGVDSDNYAEILSQIGYYFIDFETNADSAISYFTKSISIFKKTNSKTEVANINTVSEIKAQVGYASALIIKYYQTKQTSLLYKSDTIFTNVLNKMHEVSNSLGNNDKLLLIEMVNPIYNKAIENLAELYRITDSTHYANKIYNYVERSKSSALLSAVNSEHALKTSDIPNEIFEYEHQLKDEINGLQQLLEKEKTKDNPNSLNISFFETKLLSLTNKHDSLIISIETNYPKYYSVKYSTEVISPTEIKQKLANDEAIIEYQLTDSILYIVTITNKEFTVTNIAIDSNFYNSLNYIISIKSVVLSEQNFEKFNEFKYHSNKLWKTLIEPANNILGNKRLIIIPDGILGYLPFDLLIEYNIKTDSINYRDLPYLIRKHPISYTYSATLRYNSYFNLDRRKPTNNILAFAPEYGKDNSNNTKSQLQPLPFAKQEAINIVEKQGGTIYYDKEATKKKFILQAGSSNILHLAMHTIINDSLPMQSKLVFYNDDKGVASNYMFTHEIYNMNLNASMTVLSACNTGSGDLKKGEGIMSLARGFVYAGVPSIIMTLWEVQDASGSIIMDKYYDYLKQGSTKDIALQQAKLDVLHDANMAKSHPFFWSTYIVSGDTSSIDMTKSTTKYYWVTLIFSIIAIITFSILRKKKIGL